MAKTWLSLEEMMRLKAEARGFALRSAQPLHSLLSGRHASRLRGRGLQFAELRDYHPGDDVRRIDWKASQRRGRTQLRVYEEERDRPMLLLVDQRPAMYFGSRRCTKAACAAETAALAAWKGAEGGDRVGGWVLGVEGLEHLRPRNGRSGCVPLLGAVARAGEALEKDPDHIPSTGLNQALDKILNSVTHDALVLVITDLDDADQGTGERLMKLQAHNDVIVAAVYDPLGGTLRGGAGMNALTAEGLVCVPAGQAFADAFREIFQQEIGNWMNWFRGLNVPLMPLTTELPVSVQLRELLGGVS